MTPQTDKSLTFISAIRRIERLTEEIRRDGLAGFERVQAAYAEIQDLRIDLDARIKSLAERRR